MEIKVKAVDGIEEKSVQETEKALLEKVENNEPTVANIDTSKIEAAGNNTESLKEEPVKEEIKETQSSELNEEDVLSFIKNRYSKEFTSVDDMFSHREETEDLPEDVKGYFEYKKKTGRGIEDYVKLNRDFSSMQEDQLLSEYLVSSGEATDLEDVDVLMDDYRFDEALDEEKDIKKIKLAKKKAIAKAKKFFTEQKEMYKQPLESSGSGISEADQKELDGYKQYLANAENNQEEIKRKRDWFVNKTNNVFQDFKGFDFEIGDTTLTFSPGEGSKLKEAQMDSSAFVGKFIDEKTGLINDADGYHKALAIAMNPDKFATFFYEQGKSDATEDVTKKMKNVDMEQRRAPEVARKDGLQIRAMNPSSGKGLTIKSKKNNN
mgnify:CR=1 FL=1|tara:strand:+ start:9487 stop:10620 length:1134 start_codon:yes stop_codon:yes gene_type:complete